jgi:hypothetical protein
MGRCIVASLVVLGTLLGWLAADARAGSVTIANDPVLEGDDAEIDVFDKCRFARCRYRVFTVAGTATAGVDFGAADFRVNKRKKQFLRRSLVVPNLDDMACEPSETLTVRVVRNSGRAGRGGFQGVQTIVDDQDCQPVYGGTTLHDEPIPGGMRRSCVTPFVPFGDPQARMCDASLECPAGSAQGCVFTAAIGVESAVPADHVRGYLAIVDNVDDFAVCLGESRCSASTRALHEDADDVTTVSCRGSLPDVEPGADPAAVAPRVACTLEMTILG